MLVSGRSPGGPRSGSPTERAGDLGRDVLRRPAGGVDAQRGDRLVDGAPLVHHRDPGRARVDREQRPGLVEPDPLATRRRCPRRGRRRCARAAARPLRGPRTAPPPRATTPRSSASARATSARSSVAEGRLAVVDEDVRDARGRRRPRSPSSVSWKATPSSAASARPIVVLPDPGGPTRTATGPARRGHHVRSRLGDRGEVAAWLRAVSVDRVAAELLDARPAASTRATMASATTPAAGTAHTSERWWIALAASPPAMSTVSSARGHGGDRLHRGAHPQHLAGRHAALGAAGPAGAPADDAVRVALHLVVGLRAAAARRSRSRRRPRRP